jgi:hypothetical protein
MDHPAFMRGCERIGNLSSDLNGIGDRELFLPRKPGAEGFADHVRHDVVQQAGSLAGIMERKNVRMAESGCDLDLAQETLGAQRHGDIWGKHLDGDASSVFSVIREVDSPHPAPTKLALDLVTPAERRGDAGQGVQHSSIL